MNVLLIEDIAAVTIQKSRGLGDESGFSYI